MNHARNGLQMQDLKVGQVVKSKAGRDKGKVFIVLEIVDGSHVLLVDGKLRKASRPKKKKNKHLAKYNAVVDEIATLDVSSNTADAAIRKLLMPYQKDNQ